MTSASQDKLKKKQERKKQKERQKRWKRINKKIDTILAAMIIVIFIGITVLDAQIQRKNKEMKK